MKYTEETKNIVFEAISEGLAQKDAAVLAGISEDTFSRWKRDYSDFADQIRQKEIEYKKKNLRLVEKAGEKSWQAAAWLLERKYPEEFSLKQEMRVTTETQADQVSRVLDELESENEDEMFAGKAKTHYEQYMAKQNTNN